MTADPQSISNTVLTAPASFPAHPSALMQATWKQSRTRFLTRETVVSSSWMARIETEMIAIKQLTTRDMTVSYLREVRGLSNVEVMVLVSVTTEADCWANSTMLCEGAHNLPPERYLLESLRISNDIESLNQ